jgi:GxxExxY protein
MEANNKNRELVYPEESYELIGLAMEIHRNLGNIFQEKHYQKVFEEKLKKRGIPFQREVRVIAKTEDGCEIGEFFMDFVVYDKIILEFKRINLISYNDIKQVLRYLDVAGLKLGIIINFKLNRLQYKRVINPRIISY